MQTDPGAIREQLQAFARFKQAHPTLSEQEAIDKFANGTVRSKDAFSFAAAPTPGGNLNPLPESQRMSIPRYSMPCDQPAANDFFSPPTPTLDEVPTLPIAVPRSCSPALQEYLTQNNDPWSFPTNFYSETADPSYLPLDAVHFFDNPSASLGSIPQLCFDPSPSTDSYLARPATPMSRNPSGNSNKLSETCSDMFRLPSQDSSSILFSNSDTDELGIMAPSGQAMDFDYRSERISLPSKRPAEISSMELHRQEVEKAINTHSRPHARSPKQQQPSTNPAKSNKTSSRGSPTKANKPYVRPKHPRVRCPECPQDHKGFRGEHEFNRHFDRKHAVHKKAWIVRDRSGTGLLSKCKACTTGRKYGVDYNATAHLKRQHFNVAKNPDVQMPENIRDWIEEVEGGQDDRKRTARGKNSESESSKDEEGDSDSLDDEEEEERKSCFELAGSEQQQQQEEGAEIFELEVAAPIKGQTVQTYRQQMDDERQNKLLKEAAYRTYEALQAFPAEDYGFYSSRAENQSSGDCRQIISHAAHFTSGAAAFAAAPEPFSMEFQLDIHGQLLRDHGLPPTTQMTVGCNNNTTVSPTDLLRTWDNVSLS